MARRKRFNVGQQTQLEGTAIGVGPHEQARTRGGRERNCDGELWIVTPPETGIGLRPREVENEFAVRMSLDECRYGRGKPRVVFDSEVARLPARAAADATGVLQRCEELMPQKRITLAAQRVPLVRMQRIDAFMDAAAHPLGFYVSRASRYLSASRAAMQPAPAEVIACLYT